MKTFVVKLVGTETVITRTIKADHFLVIGGTVQFYRGESAKVFTVGTARLLSIELED